MDTTNFGWQLPRTTSHDHTRLDLPQVQEKGMRRGNT